MLSLRGKHICVIGGSRGIGAASAKLAGSLGASVSLTYGSNKTAADEVVSEIRKGDGKAVAYKADMQNEGEIDAAVDGAVQELGPLHGMVVSAGIFENTTIDKMTLEFWNRVIGINLTGTMLSVRAAARVMRAAKSTGSIVIYTSTAGQSGGGGASAYSASKAGQIIFMKSMAYELAPDKIRVNCIAPAWTETEMAAASLNRLGRDKVAQGCPLGRIGKATDIANATAFLLSDPAEFITSSTITVDGGMAMRG